MAESRVGLGVFNLRGCVRPDIWYSRREPWRPATRWSGSGVQLNRGDPDAAGQLLARAYLVLARLGSPDAQTAAGCLVEACGSVEAANAYLAQTVQFPDDPTTPG